MELLVWNKHWGLPSIDPDCLYSLAYCKLSAAPVDIKYCHDSRQSKTGHLPLMTDGTTHISSGKKIVDELKSRGHDLDFSLPLSKQSDLLAYKLQVETKLIPAVQYSMWCIPKNYADVTRPAWASFLPFLPSIYHPLSIKHSLSSRFEGLHRFATKGDLLEKITSNAKECLNLLSYKLEEKEFIFGQKASSLDALVFAHLALILYTDLPQSPLKSHVLGCPNLVRFCRRIMDKHFPGCAEELARLEKERQEKEKEKLKEGGEFPNKARNIVVAVSVVSVVMLAYAITLGKIRLEVINVEK